MYFSDGENHRIRKVTVSTGIITTIAGTGTASYSGDNGPATSATFISPDGITLDSSGIFLVTNFDLIHRLIVSTHLGNIYIADQANNRVRKVTVSTGIITTFAGTGSGSFSGDGGAATSAGLGYPIDVALDSPGKHLLLRLFRNLQGVNLSR